MSNELGVVMVKQTEPEHTDMNHIPDNSEQVAASFCMCDSAKQPGNMSNSHTQPV
jgi:hypothetical protein